MIPTTPTTTVNAVIVNEIISPLYPLYGLKFPSIAPKSIVSLAEIKKSKNVLKYSSKNPFMSIPFYNNFLNCFISGLCFSNGIKSKENIILAHNSMRTTPGVYKIMTEL